MRRLLSIIAGAYKNGFAALHFARNASSLPQHMKAWQIHKYGNVDDLCLETTDVPIIKNTSDVLIEIKAASINPIDLRMIEGYGSKAINALKRKDGTFTGESEFPLTLGRDFSGKIVDIGRGVGKRFKIGDEVWGTVKPSYQGSFAQFVVVPCSDISLKPEDLSHVSASSFPYAASTTWAALSYFGHLKAHQFKDKKVLILGGSGGVGTFATQLFNAFGAEVTVTVSEDFLDKALELGATYAFNYKDSNILSHLSSHGRYDLIYDLVASQDLDVNLKLLKPNLCSRYVTIINPFLKNMNKFGVPFGVAYSGLELTLKKLQGLKQGSHVSWGVFYPSVEALDTIRILIEEKKIIPVIERVFPFEELPLGMKKISSGKNRGKTVVDYSL